MTTVHDLTIDVSEIIVWHLLVLSQIVVKHITANLEITIVEVIVSGPTLGTELLSTENQRVEHTETEQQGFEFLQFMGGGFFEMAFIELCESSSDISLQVLWGFISNLDGVLQDRLGDSFHIWEWGWLR